MLCILKTTQYMHVRFIFSNALRHPGWEPLRSILRTRIGKTTNLYNPAHEITQLGGDPNVFKFAHPHSSISHTDNVRLTTLYSKSSNGVPKVGESGHLGTMAAVSVHTRNSLVFSWTVYGTTCGLPYVVMVLLVTSRLSIDLIFWL